MKGNKVDWYDEFMQELNDSRYHYHGEMMYVAMEENKVKSRCPVKFGFKRIYDEMKDDLKYTCFANGYVYREVKIYRMFVVEKVGRERYEAKDCFPEPIGTLYTTVDFDTQRRIVGFDREV